MDEDSETRTEDVMAPSEYMDLTEQCHHYTNIADVPWDLQKYWHQRYSIFPNYDDEVYLTDDAWFGVTPQPVADKIAEDIHLPDGVPAEDTVIVDMFAGVGGNTIAFARSGRWGRVIGIERDADTLACAQNNAALYGEDELPWDAITWVHGDCLDFLDRLRHRPETLDPALRVDPRTTVLFASPPWGGISYRDQPVFDLSTMQPYGLRALHDACGPIAHALYLPRTSDLQQIADLAPERARLEVVQYCMYQASKAMVVYFPAARAAEEGMGDRTGVAAGKRKRSDSSSSSSSSSESSSSSDRSSSDSSSDSSDSDSGSDENEIEDASADEEEEEEGEEEQSESRDDEVEDDDMDTDEDDQKKA